MAVSIDGPRIAVSSGSLDASVDQYDAVVGDNDGTFSIASVPGGDVLGILVDDPRAGAGGTVQFRDVVKARAGAAFDAFTALTSGGDGTLVPALSGDTVVATALAAASGAGSLVTTLLGFRGGAGSNLASGLWLYGDGSDGAHTCSDGDPITSGNYTDFTLLEGTTLLMNDGSDPPDTIPRIICCTGTARVAGTISAVGGAARKSKVGLMADGFAFSGTNGFGSQTDAPLSVGGNYVAGGDGGNGSAGSGTTGGPANVPAARARFLYESIYTSGLSASGGGGGGDGAFWGGGGGGGGGALFIFARSIIWESSNLMDFRGGDGSPGGWSDGTDSATGPSGDCGGGGGGAGGFYVTVSDVSIGTPNNHFAGGDGGAGVGTGTDGAPGGDGFVVALDDRG